MPGHAVDSDRRQERLVDVAQPHDSERLRKHARMRVRKRIVFTGKWPAVFLIFWKSMFKSLLRNCGRARR